MIFSKEKHYVISFWVADFRGIDTLKVHEKKRAATTVVICRLFLGIFFSVSSSTALQNKNSRALSSSKSMFEFTESFALHAMRPTTDESQHCVVAVEEVEVTNRKQIKATLKVPQGYLYTYDENVRIL